MAKMLILICQHAGCNASYPFEQGDVPPRCPDCRERAIWRVAMDGEYTKGDVKFLRSLRIAVAPEDEPEGLPEGADPQK